MKALVGAFNQEKALIGAFSVIVQPVVEPMDRFAALLGTLQGNKTPSERTIFHFCDSEIFALRTQFEDGGTYKLILQEPILTSRGSCEGKNSGKYLFAVYLKTISSPALRTWESKLDVCSSSCHDCSTVPDIMLRVPAQVTASQQTLTVATPQ